jgi:hypothetical protein
MSVGSIKIAATRRTSAVPVSYWKQHILPYFSEPYPWRDGTGVAFWRGRLRSRAGILL